MSTFNLPDVGEGLTEAEIVSWKVKPGDTVMLEGVGGGFTWGSALLKM